MTECILPLRSSRGADHRPTLRLLQIPNYGIKYLQSEGSESRAERRVGSQNGELKQDKLFGAVD